MKVQFHQNYSVFSCMAEVMEIREISLEEAATLSRQVPELLNPHPVEEYRKRMQGRRQLVLGVYADGMAAGFKVGYDKLEDG